MKSSVCPQCVNAYTLASVDSALYVCPHCHAHIQTENNTIIKRGVKLPKQSSSGIQIGKPITLRQQTLKAIGRLVYRGQDDEDTWYWEEILLTDGENLYWLEYEPELNRFVIFRPVKGNPSPPNGRIIDEEETGSLTDIEGEIPWIAKIGERYTYTTYQLEEHKLYSIEHDEDGEEHFQGTVLDNTLVHQAFGISPKLNPLPYAPLSLSGSSLLPGKAFIWSALSGALFIFVLLSSFFERPVFHGLLTLCPETQISSESCIRSGDYVGPITLTKRVPTYGVKIGGNQSQDALEVKLDLVKEEELGQQSSTSIHAPIIQKTIPSTSYSPMKTFRLETAGRYYIHIASHNATIDRSVYLEVLELPLGTYLPKLREVISWFL